MTEEKKTLTEEEEADEIVRRLSVPPKKPKSLEDELNDILLEEIQEMANIAYREMLEEMAKHGQRGE